METVLVTGGAGYVGSHACKALARAGYRPVVYDDLSMGHRWAVKWGPIEPGNLNDPRRLDEVFGKYRPVAVMHFAALAYVGESVSEPAKYYRNNVAGSIELLDAMRKYEVAKIVFSSTCSTYGIPDVVPIPDNHVQVPINPYGETKLAVERMLRHYDRAYGIRYASLRYFNAAGADPDCELGEEHDPETHLIPLVLQVAAGKRPCVTIYGTDYPTEDGTCVRDYVHVADLAEAHVLALGHLRKGRLSVELNLGTGKGASVIQVIATAKRVTGRDVPAQIAGRRPGDPPVLVASMDRAVEVLGWRPRFGTLELQIEHAWRWATRPAA